MGRDDSTSIDGWLAREGHGVVIGAPLKREYGRSIMGQRSGVRLVFLGGAGLGGADEPIGNRLVGRRRYFVLPSLVDSQFANLEPGGPDENPSTVAIDQPVERIVDQITAVLTPGNGSGELC